MSLGDKHIDRRVKFFPVFRVLERCCAASFRASTPPSFAASSASSSSADRRSQPAVRSHPRLYIVLRRKRNHRRRLIPCLVAAPAVMKGPENDPPSSNSVDKRRARTHAHALAIQGSPLPNTRWALRSLRSPGTRFRSIRQRQRPPHVASCLNSYPRHLAPAAAVQ